MSKQAYLDVLRFWLDFLETHQTDEVWCTALRILSSTSLETRDHIIMTTDSSRHS